MKVRGIIAISFVLIVSTIQAQIFNISTDKDTMLIGDHVSFTLHLNLKKGNKGIFPTFKDSIGKLEIIEVFPIDTGLDFLEQKIVGTLFEEGTYTFTEIPALILDEKGKIDTFFANEIVLKVNTLKVDTTLAFKDIKTFKSPPFPWKFFLTVVAIVLLILVAIISYVIRKKKLWLFKEKSKTALDYYHEALKKLEVLEKKQLWQNDQVKEYYLNLSEILRTYLEGRWNFKALECTTDEIKSNLILNKIEHFMAIEVLNQADLAKFAKFKPIGEDNKRMLQLTKAFIHSTQPKKEEKKDV
jgi:hypothetical protein